LGPKGSESKRVSARMGLAQHSAFRPPRGCAFAEGATLVRTLPELKPNQKSDTKNGYTS
jgi:hypothetical protein